MNVEQDAPCVHILLATYQGERHVAEQLASIAGQSHANWTLTISDDGSVDGTKALCEAFARTQPEGKVRLFSGPRQHATANFLHLLTQVDDTGDDSGLFAFCDQDDVWLPHKLSRSVHQLRSLGAGPQQPALYAARTRFVNEQLEPLGLSPLPRRPLGFGNALLQNVASGNTMVFNASLRNLLLQVRPEHAVLHDWLAYQVVTGCGGLMHFDPEPVLLYRQHAHNLIGAQSRFSDKLGRIGLLMQGQYRRWGDQTEAAMTDLADNLDDSAKALLEGFRLLRSQASLLSRLAVARRCGLWRQTRSGQASFWLGLAMNKI